MIKQLLSKFGFIHKDTLTEEYLCEELAKLIGDPTVQTVESDQEQLIFKDLARVDGLIPYLTATMARDMQRDFGSTPDQRPIIRGAFARTAYLKGKIIEVNKSLLS